MRDAWGHTTTRVAPDSIHDGAAHRAHDACVRRGETDGDDDDEDDRRQERRAPGCRRGEQGEEESRFGPIARPRERGGDALGGWIQLSRVDGTFRDSCARARARDGRVGGAVTAPARGRSGSRSARFANARAGRRDDDGEWKRARTVGNIFHDRTRRCRRVRTRARAVAETMTRTPWGG